MFCLTFILLLTIYIIFEIIQTKKNQYRVSVTDAVTIVNKGKGVYVDLRNKESFEKAHIIGALNIKLDEISKSNQIAKYKSKPIVFYGENYTKAMKEIHKKKFEKVFVLKGGLNAWIQASYPIKSNS